MTKVTKATISKIYRPVQNDTHKGIQGHALIIGGSYGKIGAPLLSSKAALHSGCGLVTSFIPKVGYLHTVGKRNDALFSTYQKDMTEEELEIELRKIGIDPAVLR